MTFSSTFQQNYYAYISLFDGNKKDFWEDTEIQLKFNAIVHQSFIDVDAIKLVHAHLFALGSKAICFCFHRMSADVYYVKYRLVNWKTDVTIQQLITTQDGRVVDASPRVYDAYLLSIDRHGDEMLAVTTPKVVQIHCRPAFAHRRKSEGQIRGRQIHHLRI